MKKDWLTLIRLESFTNFSVYSLEKGVNLFLAVKLLGILCYLSGSTLSAFLPLLLFKFFVTVKYTM